VSATAIDWLRVKSLFAQAQDQPIEERDAWLKTVCAGDAALLNELRSLLAAQSAPDCMGGTVSHLLTPLLAEEHCGPGVDERIGPYKLLRLLGEGGMGRVFLAERADGQFRQQVALKLIRAEFASTELRERFLRERDILARLAHPNIAQLHDGGVSADGAPYFTLEYVEGEPLTRWCDLRKMGIPERLKLLLKVCEAVQYAHRNLVVHRDLKPSNILVTTDGEPKLLDFGIAKPLDETEQRGITNAQSQPMTREYAAPEQVLGEPVTTTTDVYALGVLLYELLCGHLPYARAERGEVSWPKAIIDESPEPLTRALARPVRVENEEPAFDATITRGGAAKTLHRALRGDLERIVQRALEKAPEARFASVDAFADDVRAHLEGRALPGGNRRYRMAKFLRRHRAGVAVGSLMTLLVIAGIAGVVYQARETAKQAQTVTVVKDFLLSLFNASSPNEAKGRDLSVRELLDRGSNQIDHGLETQPELRSELQGVLGRIYFQLGLYDQARTLQQSALAPGNRSTLLATATLQRQFAETLAMRGDLANAEPLIEQASEVFEEDATSAPERIRTWIAWSGIAQKESKAAASEDYARRAVDLARSSDVPKELLGNALSAQGLAEWDLRNVTKSEALYREALQIHRNAFGDIDLRVAYDRQNLTLALRNLGRYSEALEQARQNLAICEKILGPQHPDVSRALSTLGTTLYHMAQYEEAEQVLRRGVAVARSSLGDDNPITATALNNLGLVLTDWHGLDEAERVYDEALRIYAAHFTAGHNSVLIAASNLAFVHGLQGKLEQAERELRDLLVLDRQGGIRDEVWELNRLGDVRRKRGDWREAVTLHRQALEESVKLFAPNARQTALSHYYLGAALVDGGQRDEAQAELRAAIDCFKGLLPPDGAHPWAATARLTLGKLLVTRAVTHGEGVRLLQEAVALRERFLGSGDARTVEARNALAAVDTSAH
jgi:eukaryotic-like serine/threonine-protein kinase